MLDSRARDLARREDLRLIRGSGVDPAQYMVTDPPAGVPLVVLPARILKDKGVEEFVEAARQLKAEGVTARFALVGDPDELNPASIPAAVIAAWVNERRGRALGMEVRRGHAESVGRGGDRVSALLSRGPAESVAGSGGGRTRHRHDRRSRMPRNRAPRRQRLAGSGARCACAGGGAEGGPRQSGPVPRLWPRGPRHDRERVLAGERYPARRSAVYRELC